MTVVCRGALLHGSDGTTFGARRADDYVALHADEFVEPHLLPGVGVAEARDSYADALEIDRGADVAVDFV